MKPLVVTESDLQAYGDGVLPESRHADIENYLSTHREEAERIQAYREQKLAIKSLYSQVLDEAIPERLYRAAATPPGLARQAAGPWRLPFASLSRIAAGFALVFVGAAAGWIGRGSIEPAQLHARAGNAASTQAAEMTGLARRAAMAHLVYSPEVLHPVEVGSAQKDHLVKWLSKRLGSPLHPPKLDAQGYDLMGGRLLPGSHGPVAQFMYQDTSGRRLTLYVSTENTDNKSTGFRFAQEGPVNVFYWIDGKFGYALSGGIDKSKLVAIATAVYEQLEPG